MIGIVIAPLDGSELAERALGYAVGIGERVGVGIKLVRVISPDESDQKRAKAEHYLDQTSARLPGSIEFEVTRGKPAERIVEIAQSVKNSVVVMSTHGRGGFQRWMTGSVAEEVVRSAGVPVLLVRGDKELPPTLAVKNILAPVDGSLQGEEALEYAITLARAFNSTIHLLRVVDTPSAYAMLSRHMDAVATGDVLDEIIESMKRESSEYLNKLEQAVRDEGVRVKTIMLEGYAGEQLVEYERRGYFQLVVMATAGRSGVSRVVFGSVAERVLKLGRSPVMMISPQRK